MENQNKTRIAFGIVVFSLLIALIVGGALIALLQFALPNIDITTTTFISMFISTLLIGIPVIIYLKSNGFPLAENLRFNKISLRTLISIVILSIGLIILVDEFDRIIYAIFGQPDFLEELTEQLKFTTPLRGFLIIASTVFAAPLVEEMLFRGYLQKVLEESWQDITKAILVTSLFFALVHLNLYWVAQIYLLGLVLGWLAWRTNSIIPGIILHGINNGFSVALNNFGSVFDKHYNWHQHVMPVWIGVAIALVILGFTMLNRSLESSS